MDAAISHQRIWHQERCKDCAWRAIFACQAQGLSRRG